MNNKAVEIVKDLGFIPKDKWHEQSFWGEQIEFATIDINGTTYCVSCTSKCYICSKEGKKGLIIVYHGYSLNKLKEAIMREEKPINA